MIDVIGPSAQNQVLQALNRVDRREEDAASVVVSERGGDSVSISSEAQNIFVAQESSAQIRSNLQNDTELTLSADPERLNALV